MEVLCDFDGTITNDDIGFKIIKTFAGQGWQEVEDAYQRGEKGSREALAEIFALTTVSEKTLRRFVEEQFFVDPFFPAFLLFCRHKKVNVTVLSDGFDFYIDLMFEKYKIDVPYYANRLKVVDCVLYSHFPNASLQCGSCGTCKLDYAKRVKENGKKIIYIGDGRSDRCVSRMADIVFAKGFLANYCDEHSIPYHLFESFNDILEICRF